MKLKNLTDRYYLLFLLLAFIILIQGLGSFGLAETSEARYAEISREMLMSGDYLNPTLLDIFHFHKPPITYYITTLGYQIFGINEFGARFFMQVAIIIQLILVYLMANLIYKDKRIAFMSGLIYFSIPIVLISSRNLTTDAFLTTFIIGALYCWNVFSYKNKTGFLYLFYLLLGIALLTKGPVALLFIIVYILTDKIINKKGFKLNIHHVLGVLLCAVIGSSWFVAVIIENPKIWDYFINKQIAGRVTGDSFSERSEPFWYYLPILFGILLPWFLGLIPRFKTKITSVFDKPKNTKVLLYSSVCLFILFSIFSTKLILYILPIFWMIAIFIASELLKTKKKTRKIIIYAFGALLTLLCLGLAFFWVQDSSDINVSTSTLLISIGAVIIFVVANYLIENSKIYKPAMFAALFGGSLVLISTHFMAGNSELTNSTRDMVKFIDHVSNDKNKTIMVYDDLLTSIPFYTDDAVITLKLNHRKSQREIQFENDESYKDKLWDLNEDQGVEQFSETSKHHSSFLLVKNRRSLDEQSKSIVENFEAQKRFKKWTLYYHK